MDDIIKNRIESSGLKKKHIAKELEITASYLSMCMNGKRILSRKKEEKLLQMLSLTRQIA